MEQQQDQDWETLIASRMRPCVALKIEDASKRNSANAVKKWRKKNADHYKAYQKEWFANNPDKVKVYRERNKKNVKRWAEEHHDRVLELGRINNAKRRKDPKRIAWTKEYLSRPEVKAKRAEYDRKRNQKPERKEYNRLRSQRRREAKKLEQLKKQENTES